MRKVFPIAAGLTAVVLLAGCSKGGLDRTRPNEFAVARQAPLVVPPNFSLAPPQPGAPRPQDVGSSQQALDAMFGGPAPRSDVEREALDAAGEDVADPGIRSEVGDAETSSVDKGRTTQDIIAAPEGDGRAARVTTP
ncbi:DUF3035 domain-containing protein [Stakelama saccharophila]|uniref:DUF3035 domain-containing protein n=1 Tax=Stakelama saccharophila TaxID=3075605 RepID=A0ABZ0BAE3_9SPHN|nr:DUF3035 domain-containing protein [Stakelama sp. W311]WNO54244.1 DUF3035 domain-containing protein [Stakelama sp. W311]